jgi:CheY-like chemotaxis protein/DNA-binding transcriptional regulator YiaG
MGPKLASAQETDIALNAAGQQKSVYVYIGQRIRERRKLLNLSQSQLAEMAGFSYQQMQKYENGASQISAGKLLLFAKIMNVPPSYFYEGLSLDDTIGKRIENNVIQKTRTEPLRILLVEDSPADIILFKKALESCSDAVDLHSIHDPETVMDFLQNHQVKYGQKQPDLVILDLSMPKISGMELLKSIKKHPKTLELPVVILTNSISIKDMMSSYREGAAGFIQKSVDMEEYTESVGIIAKYWSKIVALPCN